MKHPPTKTLATALLLACAVAVTPQENKVNHASLPLSTDFGSRVLTYDYPTFSVGIAEYPDGPTGTTVFRFEDAVPVALDVRGGSPGVVGDYGIVHAISLAGGSLLGLETISGVVEAIFEKNEHRTDWYSIPLVSGGIVYDFGGPARSSIYPDKRLGRTAYESAVPNKFPLGTRGAGRYVTVGNGLDSNRGEQSGQGAAFREIGGLKIFAAVVLNAIGAVHDRNGNVVLGHADSATGIRESYMADIERRVAEAQEANQPANGNTTLTVVIVNKSLNTGSLRQLARQVHSSMARGIQPFQTNFDGDALWFVSTNETELPVWSDVAIGTVASEVVWDAILTAHP